MPLNTLRLNHQKSSHPNDRIVFIKPLPRPASDQASYDLADTYLRAIAAQCLPIMKKHYLSVTTLEEYEPNREFIGRNFNNGEIIQLVLQSKNGGWIPFNMVQMVMMHELAHNAHMNHGRDFWKTRNMYAEELKALWTRGYTGEGFWGSGRTLSEMGAVMGNNVLGSDQLQGLPLCGGTFRSRRRKRQRKGANGNANDLTWKEKRDRRIEKKFGKNGVALGEDEDQRLRLEFSRRGPVGTKPRVAQSKRGRELRAAAALARFETNKKVENAVKGEEMEEEEEEYEEVDVDAGEEDARDVNGVKLLDSHGHGMVRVCDDEDVDDVNVQHELQELGALDRYFKPMQKQQTRPRRQPQPQHGDGKGNGDDDGSGDVDGDGDGSNPQSYTVDAEPKSTGSATNASNSADTAGNNSKTDRRSRRTTKQDKSSNIVTPSEQPSTHPSQDDHTPQDPTSPYLPSTCTTSKSSTSPTLQPRPASTTTPASKAEPTTTITVADSPPLTPSLAAADTTLTTSRIMTEKTPVTTSAAKTRTLHLTSAATTTTTSSSSSSSSSSTATTSPATISCPICSLKSSRLTATCTACSHVLDPNKDPRNWSCRSETCRARSAPRYLNSGDAGVCGICGAKRGQD
ncbi:hypothetical protein A1O1_00436 [Capronia coronata CBS 617.96]|uniref:WLM domain-containing protein n=1 Tax=Capronia coronata CBS 617.96 TaxID=1182541 RepID=W9Z160_9EURO|nr:uncharacterized protein A1O1_00436 [Capronia coronata CBS 617.96]EXJ95316.1 hypothetical protein A1O1_00436 [Capronia coronata CBS 617.96]